MEGHYYCLLFGDTSASVSRKWQKLQKKTMTLQLVNWDNILTLISHITITVVVT
jgi:hypothetical protein